MSVKLFGHPVHQMLIVLPLGLLAPSIGFDIAYLFSDNGRWADVSFLMIGAGIICGLVAAVFGFLDWKEIPAGSRAKRIGMYHGVGNVIVVALFAASWFMRYDIPTAPTGRAIAVSALGVVLAAVTGWLGGELVDRLGVGVDRGAHINAPNSLKGEMPGPARQNGRDYPKAANL